MSRTSSNASSGDRLDCTPRMTDGCVFGSSFRIDGSPISLRELVADAGDLVVDVGRGQARVDALQEHDDDLGEAFSRDRLDIVDVAQLADRVLDLAGNQLIDVPG